MVPGPDWSLSSQFRLSIVATVPVLAVLLGRSPSVQSPRRLTPEARPGSLPARDRDGNREIAIQDVVLAQVRVQDEIAQLLAVLSPAGVPQPRVRTQDSDMVGRGSRSMSPLRC